MRVVNPSPMESSPYARRHQRPMRGGWTALVAALIASASVGTHAQDPEAAACPQPLQTLRGRVTDAESGEGLSGVKLSLRPARKSGAAERGRRFATERGGAFVLDDVCVPTSAVVVTREGYRPQVIPLPKANAAEWTILLESTRVVRLDDVIVLAPQNISREAGARTATLDEEALASIRGDHLAGSLAKIPGVTMLQAGPQSAKPVVRGQFGRRLLTLFDGVRHEAQDWGVDHAPEIDPFAAGSLHVVKGAAQVRYGPDAIGGVVRIEPRPLRLAPGADGELHLIGVDNGWRGTVAGRVDVATSWVPGLSLRIEGNATKGAAVSTPDYVLGNTGSEAFNGAITVGYATEILSNAVEAKLVLRHHQARLGVCYCLTATTPDDLKQQLRAAVPLGAERWVTTYTIDRPYQAVAHEMVLARVTTELFGAGDLSATYNFQFDVRDEFDTARRAITGPQFHFELATHALDVVYQHPQIPLGRFSLAGSAGGQLLVQDNVYSGLQLIPNYRRFMGGVFAIESLTIEQALGGTLVLEVGGRYDQLAQTAFLTERSYSAQLRRGRIDEGLCTLGDDEVARCPLAFPALSFSLASTWTHPLPIFGAGSVFSLAGDLSTATRFPDVDELYLGGRSPSFPVFGLGDASLGPETTIQGALSFGLRTPLFAGEASAFVNQIHNYIAFAPAIGPDGNPQIDVVIQGAFPRYVYRATDAIFYGGDLRGTIAPDHLVSLAGQLSWVRALDLKTGGYIPFVPPPSAQVEVTANIPRVWKFNPSTLTGRGRAVFEQTRTDIASDFARPPRGYFLADVVAQTSIEAWKQELGLSLEVRNVFNQRSREYLSLLRYYADQPGREIWLRMRLNFQTL